MINSLSVITQMKDIDTVYCVVQGGSKFFPLVAYIPYRTVMTFEIVVEILKCHHSNESYCTLEMRMFVLKIIEIILKLGTRGRSNHLRVTFLPTRKACDGSACITPKFVAFLD